MSIIYEALKKTEKIIHTDLKFPLDSKPQKSKFKVKIIALYVLMIFLGLVIGNLIIGLLNHPAQTKVVKNPPVPSAPLLKEKAQIDKKVETVSETPPVVKVEPGKPFVLNGIFFSDNDSYALVNNKIVRENDFVDTAKVKTITANTVELDNAGKTITLATQR